MSEAQDRQRGAELFVNLLNSVERMGHQLQETGKDLNEIRSDFKITSNSVRDASNAFTSNKTTFFVYGALCGLLVGISGGLFGYTIGTKSTWARAESAGYQKAVDTNAAASWANTESGIMARKLDGVGALQPVATCNVKGFGVEKGDGGSRWCVIGGADGQTYGWQIP